AFKEAYITRFHAMQAELLNSYKQPALPETITPAQQREIQELVSSLSQTDKAYGKRYGAIKSHFKIAKYNQLLVSDLPEAFEIIQGVIVDQKSIGENMSEPSIAGTDANIEKLLRSAALLDGKIILPKLDMMNLVRSHYAAIEAQRQARQADDIFLENIANIEKELGVTLDFDKAA
ncbi:MAG: hypothetical protein R8M45_04205, partial [Ghiorsea sp.]